MPVVAGGDDDDMGVRILLYQEAREFPPAPA